MQSVFETFLMKGRFPVYVLSITLPTDCVDVNVHPSKKEVKFDNPNKIYGLVRRAIEKALLSIDQIQYVDCFAKGDFEISDNNNLVDNHNLSSLQTSLNPSTNILNDSIKESNDLLGQGKSFSIDLFDPNEKILDPKDLEVELSSEDQINQGENQETQDNKDIKDLENLSIKSKYDVKNNTTFFFDQKGEKHTKDIKNRTFLNTSIKDEMKVLGTLFKTYIVIEFNDAVYFIDQHAAHERLLYDKLVQLVDNNELVQQDLLAPFSFSLGAKESQNIDYMLDELNKLGFEIVKNGYNYTIKSVPLILSYIELEKFVDEIIKEGSSWDKKKSDFIHEKLCQSACKHAIKAGDEISKDECAYIIEEVRKGLMLCPHGRPITLVITKHEFEKMFKRVL